MVELMKPLAGEDGTAKPWTRQRLQQAMLEMGLAYYWKNIHVQYDSTVITAQPEGYNRLCSLAAPEEGWYDSVLYSVCSDYLNDICYQLFGEQLQGSPREILTTMLLNIPVTDPMVVMKFGIDDGMTDRAAAQKLCRESLQVGDFLVNYGVRPNGGTGHIMMYAGDFFGDGTEYMMHCWGAKFDPKTGIDKIELPGKVPGTHPLGGAIRIDPVDELCFTPQGKASILSDDRYGQAYAVLRVLDHPRFQKEPLPQILTRMQYRGICVDRFCNKNIYGTVCTGDRLTVTVQIKNNCTEAYKSVPVTEVLPEGTELVSGALQWTVDVPAGRSVSLSYEVLVTARGKVVFTGGKVGNIATRSFTIPVSRSRLTHGQKEKLASLPLEGLEGDLSELRFVKQYYKAALGMDVHLPDTANELFASLFERQDACGMPDGYEGKMLVPKPSEYADMVINEHLSGTSVFIGGHPMVLTPNRASHGRVKQYWEQYYEVGDVFVTLARGEVFNATAPKRVHVYIYLGEHTVATAEGYRGFGETVECMLGMPVTVGLRPGKV